MMDRRTFLALMASPALLPLLQSCGDAGDGGTDGFRFIGSSVARASTVPADASRGASALNALGADLYARLAARDEANIVFSPASIMVALAMTRAGAVGATATEMDTVLHTAEAGPSQDDLHRALNAMTGALESRSGTFKVDDQDLDVTLSITNSLWGQEGVGWRQAFLDLLASEYGAGMRVVDYVAETERARRAINGWVSRETKERIPELLGEGTVTPNIVLTLVNAVYMKAPWMNPFPVGATVDGPFTTIDGTTAMVPLMKVSAKMAYSRGDGWQSVRIPYVGGSLEMMIIVPDAGSLATVESSLAEGLMGTAAASSTERMVNLGLPRFDTETKVDLREVMEALGMRAAFDPDLADFSAMTDERELFVSFIVHQANISVDEKGTEAAAATAVGMGDTAAPGEPVTIDVDRPFVFAVRDVPTGATVFLGRVGDPR